MTNVSAFQSVTGNNTSGPASSVSYSGPWVAGLYFKVTAASQFLYGFYLWRADSSQSASADFALWTVTSSGVGTVNAATEVTGSGFTAGNWNFVSLATPFALTSGTTYMAVYGYTAGNFPETHGWFTTGGPGVNGYVNGPLTVFSGVSSSGGTGPQAFGSFYAQGSFGVGGSSSFTTLPSSDDSEANFWIDVLVGPASSPTIPFVPNPVRTKSGLIVPARFAPRSRQSADGIRRQLVVPPETMRTNRTIIPLAQVQRRRQSADMVPTAPAAVIASTFIWDAPRYPERPVSRIIRHVTPPTGWPVPVQPPELPHSLRRESRPLLPRHSIVPSTGWPVKVQPPNIPDGLRGPSRSPGRRRGKTPVVLSPPPTPPISTYTPNAPRYRNIPVRRRKARGTSSGTWPGSTITTYRLMDGKSGRPGVGSSVLTPPASPISYSGPFEEGLYFAVTQSGYWFEGYWWYVPTGGDTSPQKFCLYTMSGTGAGEQEIVPGTTVTSGTLTAGQFNWVPLAAKVPLSIGAIGTIAGGLYGAMTAWTASHGFPDSPSQMGALYPNGIQNGPLVTFGVNNPSRGIGQGSTFSSTISDPTTGTAFGVSSDDMFWLDVQVTSIPPVTVTAPYRLYPNRLDWNNVSAADSFVNYNVATQINVLTSCLVDRIYYYSPAGTVQLATEAGIFTIEGTDAGTKIASNTSPSWSGVAGSGWISTPISPIVLPPGSYKFYVFNGAVSPDGWSAKDANSNYWATGEGANGIQWGPIIAPNLASSAPAYEFDGSAGGATPPFSNGSIEPGQSTFAQSGSASYPYLYVDGLAQNYWIDADFTPVTTTSIFLNPVTRIREIAHRLSRGTVHSVPPVAIQPTVVEIVSRRLRYPLKRSAKTVGVSPVISGSVPPVERTNRFRVVRRVSKASPVTPAQVLPQFPFNPRATVRTMKLHWFRKGTSVPGSGLPVKIQPPERMQLVRRWIRPLLPRRGVIPSNALPFIAPPVPVEVKLPVWVWIESSIPATTITSYFPYVNIEIFIPDENEEED